MPEVRSDRGRTPRFQSSTTRSEIPSNFPDCCWGEAIRTRACEPPRFYLWPKTISQKGTLPRDFITWLRVLLWFASFPDRYREPLKSAELYERLF